jgi:cell division protein FtsI/penicillin-binding protein 2
LAGAPDPGTQLAANILGYIGAANFPGSVVGKAGIEKSYNSIRLPNGQVIGLAGTPGQELVQVDRQGHPLRTVDIKPPQPGDNVVLTINAKLQALLQQALTAQLALLRTHSFPGEGGPYPDSNSAGAVVIDVRTGAVLAAASIPTLVSAPAAYAAKRNNHITRPSPGELPAGSVRAARDARGPCPWQRSTSPRGNWSHTRSSGCGPW